MDEEDHPQELIGSTLEEDKTSTITAPKPKLERAGTYHQDTPQQKVGQSHNSNLVVVHVGKTRDEGTGEALT